MTKLSSKLKSSFVLASEIPLPLGQNFSIIPWFNPSFSRMGGGGGKTLIGALLVLYTYTTLAAYGSSTCPLCTTESQHRTQAY